jgi:hypothetical protein
MPVVIDFTVEDGGLLWRAALKLYLSPLRIIRGVDLKFDGLGKLGGQGVHRGHLIRESLRSREKALRVFARIERIRKRFLERLVEQVLQHA